MNNNFFKITKSKVSIFVFTLSFLLYYGFSDKNNFFKNTEFSLVFLVGTLLISVIGAFLLDALFLERYKKIMARYWRTS